MPATLRPSLRLRPDVSLLPLHVDHAAAMFRWMQDPMVSENVGLRTEPTLEKTHSWIERALEGPTIRAFAVVWDRRHVGNVIFDQIDSYLSNARLSVYIGESDARHSGVGSTALYLAVKQ